MTKKDSPTFRRRPPTFPEIDEARYRDQLADRMKRTQDPALTLATINTAYRECLGDFHHSLPPVAKTTKAKIIASMEGVEEPAGLKIPLIDVLPNVPQAVENLALPFFGEDALNLKLFAKLRTNS